MNDVRTRQLKAGAKKGFTVEQINRMIRSHNKGTIIICPRCSKVDIHPLKHLEDCDPVFEQYRQESENHAWNAS